MTTTRRKIEIIAALLILISLGVLLWWLLHRMPATENGTIVDAGKTLPQQTTKTTTSAGTPTTTAQQNLPPTAQTIGRSFVERFGSFSNESEYKNIYDVLSMTTPRLQDELRKLAEEAKQAAGGAYYGISTDVISLRATSVTETQVGLTITTRRQESIDTPANTTTRTQEIKLTLVKSGDDWLVDTYAWQD